MDLTNSHIVGIPDAKCFWMRSVSFASLHRILRVIVRSSDGLRPVEINQEILDKGLIKTRRGTNPSNTTLYHYRNTLLHLGILYRHGKQLRVKYMEPDVKELAETSPPASEDFTLSPRVQELFASLVLKNEDCKTIFFNLFMLGTEHQLTAVKFRQCGISVDWYRLESAPRQVVFCNKTTRQKQAFELHSQKVATLYGVRYWARDELHLIDEYSHQADGGITMFPVACPLTGVRNAESTVVPMVNQILAARQDRDWTLFSIFNLIVQNCESGRRPIKALFEAIDWIVRQWPRHIVLVPTSRAFATITSSPQGEELALRRYYRHANGPYISHVRLHRDIKMNPKELPTPHVQFPSEIQAEI